MENADDLATALAAKELQTDKQVLIIKIERLWRELVEKHGSESDIPDGDIYLAVRGSWVVSKNRAESADYVLAVARGIVRGVYRSHIWHRDNNHERRCYFEKGSEPIREEDMKHFCGKSTVHLFKRGQANPIYYLNC